LSFRRAPQNSTTRIVTSGLNWKKGGQCVTVTLCGFGWTHCLRLHGIRVLALCSLFLKNFLTVLFCCADERSGRNRSYTRSSRLDACRKFTLCCCLLQWSVPSQMDQPRSQNLQRKRFDGFVLTVLIANCFSVCDGRTV
jgi:hypothetical protein